jgi:hypothetical protein
MFGLGVVIVSSLQSETEEIVLDQDLATIDGGYQLRENTLAVRRTRERQDLP